MATSGKHSWIEDSDVFSLFPTLVWKTQLRAEVHEAIDASVLGLLRSLRQGLPELKSGEAWQSGHALHRREELRELCDRASRAAAGSSEEFGAFIVSEIARWGAVLKRAGIEAQ